MRINKVESSKTGFSAITTERGGCDNSHAYIASRINDLYFKALTRQSSTSSSARSLRRFIDKNSQDGTKLHKIV